MIELLRYASAGSNVWSNLIIALLPLFLHMTAKYVFWNGPPLWMGKETLDLKTKYYVSDVHRNQNWTYVNSQDPLN